MVLEKTLVSPLDCKAIQPVHSEGDQPWDFFGRNDAKAETPVTRQDSHIVTDLCCLADIPHGCYDPCSWDTQAHSLSHDGPEGFTPNFRYR